MLRSKVLGSAVGLLALAGCASIDVEPVVLRPIARVLITGAPRSGFSTTVGNSFRLGVIAVDSSSGLIPLELGAVWSASDPTVAAVDQAGTVTGLRQGGTYIRALVNYNGSSYTDSLPVTFTP